MPAPTSPEEAARRRKAIAAAKASGVKNPYTIAAEALGVSRNTLLNWDRNYAPQDEAIEAAKTAVRTALSPALVWAKTKPDEDGNSFSVLLKPQATEGPDLVEMMAEAFADIPAAPPTPAPPQVLADLCSLCPIFDAHIGMYAWGRETGSDDYDLRSAAEDMKRASVAVAALTPSSAEAILLIGGDYFHIDDSRNETPANRHRLDADGRYHKVIEVGVVVLVDVVERLLEKHGKLQIRVLRGNHDEHSHLVLPHVLAQRYRDEPRVSVDMDPRDIFMRQWGTSAIFAHHGDKTPLQKIVNFLCDVCPFWSATKHRHYFSGHEHRFKSEDLGPLVVEVLRAFCPPDSFGSRWASRRAMQSVTFHREDGLVQRNYDPVTRLGQV